MVVFLTLLRHFGRAPKVYDIQHVLRKGVGGKI